MKFLRLFLILYSLGLIADMANAMDKQPKNIDTVEQKKLNSQLYNLIENKIFHSSNPKQEDIVQVEDLLKQGANINATKDNNAGRTLLRLVTDHLYHGRGLGEIKNIKFLIAHGADVNKNIPLQNMLRYQHQYEDAENKTEFLNDLLAASKILLENGSNPNIMDFWVSPKMVWGGGYREENYTALDAALWYADKEPALIKLIVLYGGKVSKPLKQNLQEVVAKIFSQPLIQAIALGDVNKVKELLFQHQGSTWYGKLFQQWVLQPAGWGKEHKIIKDLDKVTRDNDGISALAYAAGHGNDKILSLLFSYPAYQQDALGIEQAIDIVTNRLKGLNPSSSEYKNYQHILEGLKKQLGHSHEQQLQVFLQGAAQQTPEFDPAKVPSEILQQIMKKMLGTHNKSILLTAIQQGDAAQVKKLLAPQYMQEVVRDNEGISAIVYAVKQGNQDIINLLLSYHAYQYDTKSLEQALEIASAKLLTLDPKSAEYKKYQAIFEALKKALGTSYNVLLEQLAKTANVPGMPELPAEMNEYIAKLMLASPTAYQALFNPHGK